MNNVEIPFWFWILFGAIGLIFTVGVIYTIRNEKQERKKRVRNQLQLFNAISRSLYKRGEYLLAKVEEVYDGEISINASSEKRDSQGFFICVKAERSRVSASIHLHDCNLSQEVKALISEKFEECFSVSDLSELDDARSLAEKIGKNLHAAMEFYRRVYPKISKLRKDMESQIETSKKTCFDQVIEIIGTD
jgi:hypothetical protein